MNSNLLQASIIVLLMALLLPASNSLAISLGDIVVRSSLDSPFLAEINLLSVKASELDTLRASLASDSDFRRANVERVDVLNGLSFKPIIRKDGAAILQVTSDQAIIVPYLHFLITLEWTGGRIVREYTILLDPPTYDGTVAAKISAPLIPKMAAESVSQIGVEKVQLNKLQDGQAYGPIERGDYLIAIGEALNVSSSISIYQRLYGILRNNPHAFIEGNMNLLRAGVVLDIPQAEELSKISRVLAVETFTRHVREWQEYRAKLAKLPVEKTESDAVAPGLGLMRETIVQLEEEIERLRGLLEEAGKKGDSNEMLQVRKQLREDVAELEAARDRLIGAMDSAPEPVKTSTPVVGSKYVLRIVQPTGEGKVKVPTEPTIQTLPESEAMAETTEDIPQSTRSMKLPENDEIVAIRKKLSLMEETLLSRALENEMLQEQIRLLEAKVQQTVTLLRIQDEALALAQRQAAVYSAALEARPPSTTNIIDRAGETNQQKKDKDAGTAITIEEKSGQAANQIGEMVQEEEVDDDTIGEPTGDDVGVGVGQNMPDKEVGMVRGTVAYLSDDSNRPQLLFAAAMLLLLLLLLAMRHKRVKSTRNVIGRTNSVIPSSRNEEIEINDDPEKVYPEERISEQGEGISTKLDLARAYIEMGENELAIELLSEVEVRGTSEQRASAAKLLQSIST